MAHIEAPITGNLWKVLVAAGDVFAPGDTVAIIESMKLEIPVEVDEGGTVRAVLVAEGEAVAEGAVLLEFEP